ncbi:hypothetical protein Plhal304r1_c024g0081451 [Plasmopara halstedii]
MSRQNKPPGDCSTMGALIFGGGDNQQSYLDERKSRRFQPETPGQSLKTANLGAAELSYYAKPSAAQELRDHLAVAPGSVSREKLQETTTLTNVRRDNYSGSRSDYFANGMDGSEGDNNSNQSRRTRRMFQASSGGSSFKLG